MRLLPLLLAIAACPAPAPDPDPTDATDHTDVVIDDGPYLVKSPVYEPQTAAELQSWLSQYGGRAKLGDQAVDAVEAYLAAEDALRDGDVTEAGRVLDAVWAKYPVTDPSWGGTSWTVDGSHVGYPAAYYGLRMLTEVVAQGGKPAAEAEPIRLTLVLVGCSEGVIPDTRQDLADGAGTQQRLALDPALVDNASAWTNQATWPFAQYVQAMTDGKLPLRVSVVHLPDTCVNVRVSEEGNRVAGPTNVGSVFEAIPDEIRADTHWWWVLHPSAVPTGSEFEGVEFITGGMGRHSTGAPMFLSDDKWLVRKPPHMGQGPWFDVERRIYFNQWLQHEFMHHLFLVYPEFELEVTGHQWFDRSTWPADFEGRYEPDYYDEALQKRLKGASTPLAVQLRYGVPPRGLWTDLPPSALMGTYQREPVTNGWHRGTIAHDGEALRWTNEAGVSWGLEADLEAGVLRTGADCPYDDDFALVPMRDPQTGAWTTTLAGFRFNGELYAR